MKTQGPDKAKQYLVDGKYSFVDLVDIDRLKAMFERFSQATGFTTGLVSYPIRRYSSVPAGGLFARNSTALSRIPKPIAHKAT
jgi:hypothetical protein